LDPVHAVAEVLTLGDDLLAHRLEVARPATAGNVLGIGIEQRLATTGAVIGARRLGGLVLADEGTLSATQAANVELGGGKLLAPALHGFLKRVHDRPRH